MNKEILMQFVTDSVGDRFSFLRFTFFLHFLILKKFPKYAKLSEIKHLII